MKRWMRWVGWTMVLELPVALAFAFPAEAASLTWPLLALYAALSIRMLRRLKAAPWLVTIVGDRNTRVAHGLEHATIAVLLEAGHDVRHGFTHGPNGFVVALDASRALSEGAVWDAATSAVRRILGGERSLALSPYCGTSWVVTAVALWLVFFLSVAVTVVLGGGAPVLLAIGALLMRVWLACGTALGLLAQRLLTVSTAFDAVAIRRVREVNSARSWRRLGSERWFEIVITVQHTATCGGVVAPGVLG